MSFRPLAGYDAGEAQGLKRQRDDILTGKAVRGYGETTPGWTELLKRCGRL